MFDSLEEEDKKKFNFDHQSFKWEEVVDSNLVGIRKFLMKEEPETMPKAQEKLAKLFLIDQALKVFIVIFVLYWLLSRFL